MFSLATSFQQRGVNVVYLLPITSGEMLMKTFLLTVLLVAIPLTAADAPPNSPTTTQNHPFLFISREELAEARSRLNREPWYSLLAELKAQVEKDLLRPLPRFETDWWQSAKKRPWDEIYPEVAKHTMFVPSTTMSAAHRASTLYLLTGEKRFAEHLLNVLRHYSSYTFEFEHYDVGMNYAAWGTLALDIYDRIYDLCTEDDHRIIDAFFERMGEAIWKNDQAWLKHGWGGKHNNHYAYHRMALCALGLFFEKEEYTRHALHGPEGVVELLDSALMDEGLWHESSIHYHFTALHALVSIAEMLRHSDHPFDLYHRKFAGARSLKNMFDAPLLTLFPDGTIPNVGDSYAQETRIRDFPCYEYAHSVYDDAQYAWILSQGNRNPAVALLHGSDLKKIEPPSLHSHLFREHGYAFLRLEEGKEAWRATGITAMLNFDRNGIHCHHDHLSLILFGGGRLLALDAEARTSGHAFSRPVQRELNRSVVCHNTIAVDGRVDQGILTAPLQIIGWQPSGQEKSLTVADLDGKIYPGIKLARTITLSGNRIIDEFRASSDEPHLYQWLFHVSPAPSRERDSKHRNTLPAQASPGARAPAGDDEGDVRTSLTFEPTSPPKEKTWLWIRNPRRARTDADWELSWRRGDVELRLKMAAAPGTEIIACDFPQDDQFTPPPIAMLIVQRRAIETTFSATYEVLSLPR